MSHYRVLAAAAAAVVLVTAGCGGADSGSAAPAGGGDLSTKKVTFLTLTPTCEPCSRTSNAVVSTLEAQGVKVTTESSDFGAAADQIQKFNQALSTKPDAIVVWPTDTTSIIPALKLANQNQPDIPIIITTYKPATDETNLYDAFVGGDDAALGKMQAEALIAGLKKSGKAVEGGVIEIEGAPGAATTIGRKQGFETALASEAPGLRLVGTQPGNWDQTQATTAASALFSKNASSNIVGVYAHSDVMLAGAILAGERAGLEPGKDFIGVAIDCSIEGYKNIDSGKQYATGMWDPNVIGKDTGEAALTLLKGQQVAEKDTYFPTPEVTKDNLSDCKSAAGL